MKVVKNMLLTAHHAKPIATDIHFDDTAGKRPSIIYAHGFNGFKDWGNGDLIAAYCVQAGFTYIKFNFAFNGTAPETPEDFTDLDAFRENNYTKELNDLNAVIDWATSADNPYAAFIDRFRIGLIGHSMGGGIVLIKASEDERIKAVATWASVAECKTPWGSWPPERIAAWKTSGIDYIENGRTKQMMPLGYQLYEDYQTNRDRLSIEKAIKRLNIPILLVHGTSDPAVPVSRVYQLNEWQPNAELMVSDTDHVFGRKHPWTDEKLPEVMMQVLTRTTDFFKAALK